MVFFGVLLSHDYYSHWTLLFLTDVKNDFGSSEMEIDFGGVDFTFYNSGWGWG